MTWSVHNFWEKQQLFRTIFFIFVIFALNFLYSRFAHRTRVFVFHRLKTNSLVNERFTLKLVPASKVDFIDGFVSLAKIFKGDFATYNIR